MPLLGHLLTEWRKFVRQKFIKAPLFITLLW